MEDLDTGGWSMVHHAAEKGDIDELKVLLLHATEKQTGGDSCGRTPAHWAISSGHTQCLQLLLSAKAAANQVILSCSSINIILNCISRLTATASLLLTPRLSSATSLVSEL